MVLIYHISDVATGSLGWGRWSSNMNIVDVCRCHCFKSLIWNDLKWHLHTYIYILWFCIWRLADFLRRGKAARFCGSGSLLACWGRQTDLLRQHEGLTQNVWRQRFVLFSVSKIAVLLSCWIQHIGHATRINTYSIRTPNIYLQLAFIQWRQHWIA